MTVSTISKTVFFSASTETVWDYLVDKDKLGEWYNPAEASLVAGEGYTLLTKGDDGPPKKIVWGKVVESDRPSRLVTTFSIAPFEGRETTVTWVLESVAGGTRLSLTHEGVAEASGPAVLNFLTALDAGWDKHFAMLRTAIA